MNAEDRQTIRAIRHDTDPMGWHRWLDAHGGAEAFWSWVAARRAGNNPRGDFIRDTREAMRPGALMRPEEAICGACPEAVAEYDSMRIAYVRQTAGAPA